MKQHCWTSQQWHTVRKLGQSSVNILGIDGRCCCNLRTAWPRKSPRDLAMKAGRLWVWKGMGAVAAYRRRLARGELFPPFLFLALTDACNLRCRGCWVRSGGRAASVGPDGRRSPDRRRQAAKRLFLHPAGRRADALSRPLGPRRPPPGLLFPNHHQRDVLRRGDGAKNPRPRQRHPAGQPRRRAREQRRPPRRGRFSNGPRRASSD